MNKARNRGFLRSSHLAARKGHQKRPYYDNPSSPVREVPLPTDFGAAGKATTEPVPVPPQPSRGRLFGLCQTCEKPNAKWFDGRWHYCEACGKRVGAREVK